MVMMLSPLNRVAFIPDYLNFGKLDAQSYFGMIIGAVASIFGVLMAVIIISVEFLKEKIENNRYINPLERRNIQSTIHLSVNILLLTLLSYIHIDAFDNSNNITLGYYIAFLFILYIYSIYPFFTGIIEKSSKIRNVLDNVNSLIIEDFRKVLEYRYGKLVSDSKISLLKKDIDSYILSNNIYSYEIVANSVLERGFMLIGDGKDRRKCNEVFSAIVWLWRENAKTAVRNNDSQYFDLIWNSIGLIYLRAARNKIELMNLQEINMFIYFDLKSLYRQFKSTISLNNALDVIDVSFKINVLENCPKQNDIFDLVSSYEEIDSNNASSLDSSLAWKEIYEILRHIETVQEIAIELDDKNLFMECSERIQMICLDLVSDFKNLGHYQKGELVWRVLTSNYYQSSLALRKGLFSSTIYCFAIPKNLMVDVIKRNVFVEKDIRIIIKTLGEHLFNALKEHKLDFGYRDGTLEDFLKIGIGCITTYNINVVSKNTVKYFMGYFKYIKEYIELHGIEKYPQEYKAFQKAIKNYIEVGIRHGKFKENEKPICKWILLYNSFKEVENEDELGIVRWKIKK